MLWQLCIFDSMLATHTHKNTNKHRQRYTQRQTHSQSFAIDSTWPYFFPPRFLPTKEHICIPTFKIGHFSHALFWAALERKKKSTFKQLNQCVFGHVRNVVYILCFGHLDCLDFDWFQRLFERMPKYKETLLCVWAWIFVCCVWFGSIYAVFSFFSLLRSLENECNKYTDYTIKSDAVSFSRSLAVLVQRWQKCRWCFSNIITDSICIYANRCA